MVDLSNRIILTWLLLISSDNDTLRRSAAETAFRECKNVKECEQITEPHNDVSPGIMCTSGGGNYTKCAVYWINSKVYNKAGRADQIPDLTKTRVKCTEITNKEDDCYKVCINWTNKIYNFPIRNKKVPACKSEAKAYGCPLMKHMPFIPGNVIPYVKRTCTCAFLCDEDITHGKIFQDGDTCPSISNEQIIFG